MKKIIYIAIFIITISSTLFGSKINLIEPKEAVRLIGNNQVVFVSGDNNKTYMKNHIIGSIRMCAYHLHFSDANRSKNHKPLYSCPKKAREYIQSKGIRSDQVIIAYDNLYGYNAMGVYSFFKSFGHIDIKVLNGGVEEIMALDPNQKVFDKLKIEQQTINKDIKVARDLNNSDKVDILKDDIESLIATMNILRPKLLIQGGEEHIHKESSYFIEP